jgi:hypothetical protein
MKKTKGLMKVREYDASEIQHLALTRPIAHPLFPAMLLLCIRPASPSPFTADWLPSKGESITCPLESIIHGIMP